MKRENDVYHSQAGLIKSATTILPSILQAGSKGFQSLTVHKMERVREIIASKPRGKCWQTATWDYSVFKPLSFIILR